MSERTHPEFKTDDLDAAVSVSRKKLVANAAANYMQMGVQLVCGLFLQAYLVRTLGKEQYSLWPLAGTCIGVLGLIPIGVGYGAGRFLAHALAGKRLDEAGQITSSLFFAMCAAACLYALGVLYLSLYFEQIFDIPTGAAGIGPWVMLFLGLAGAVSMPFSVFRGGLVATQRLVPINILTSASAVLRITFIVVLFLAGFKSLIWVALIRLVLTLVESVAILRLARRLVPWQKVRLSMFRWKVLRTVATYSGLVLLWSFCDLLYWQTHYVIINKLMMPAFVTGYALVIALATLAHSMGTRGSGVLMPAIASLLATGQKAKVGRLAYRSNRVIVPLVVPAQLLLMLCGGEILALYAGPQFHEYGDLFWILGFYYIIASTLGPSKQVVHASGRLGGFVAVMFLSAIGNVGLSVLFVLVAGWGLFGLAVGAVIARSAHAVYQHWYVSRFLDLPLCSYLWRQIAVPLLHCLPVSVVMISFRVTGVGAGGWSLLLLAGVSACVHATYLLLWGLPERERAAIRQIVKRLLSRIGLLNGNRAIGR